MRIVVDTNVLVSAFLSPTARRPIALPGLVRGKISLAKGIGGVAHPAAQERVLEITPARRLSCGASVRTLTSNHQESVIRFRGEPMRILSGRRLRARLQRSVRIFSARRGASMPSRDCARFRSLFLRAIKKGRSVVTGRLDIPLSFH